jgi:hypothetical protein
MPLGVVATSEVVVGAVVTRVADVVTDGATDEAGATDGEGAFDRPLFVTSTGGRVVVVGAFGGGVEPSAWRDR